MEQLGAMYAFVVLFLVILAILWFLLPFAVFGTKDKLNQLIAEAKATNKALQELTQEMAAVRKGMAAEWEDRHRTPSLPEKV